MVAERVERSLRRRYTDSVIPPADRPAYALAKPWTYLLATLGGSWVCWWIAAALPPGVPAVRTALHYCGGVIPAVVVVVLLFFVHDRDYRADYSRRIFDVRRIGATWWLAVLLFSPAKSLVALGIDRFAGGAGGGLEATYLLERPVFVLPMLLFWIVFGPLPEELGWRGYALGGLLGRHSALVASLIIGVVWSLWHLPLYFIDGTYQAEQVGLFTTRFWLFMGGTLLEPVLYTWIFVHTGGSTLAAVLFHFSGNATGELVELSPRAEVVSFVILVVAVIVVISTAGPRDLGQKRVLTPLE